MENVITTAQAASRSPSAVPASRNTSPVVVKATQVLHTPAGMLLGRMYYDGFIDATLLRKEGSGCPHTGGEHTLTLQMAPDDMAAWLQLVEERYATHYGVQDFVRSVKERAIAKYSHLRDIFGVAPWFN
jgi:hypothetical protein